MSQNTFRRLLLIVMATSVAISITVSFASAQTNIVVVVPESAKVRLGPGTYYDQLGELTAGQTAPATGRTQYNDWVQIDYATGPLGKGWVYINLIELQGGTVDQLPLVQTPPTATLPPTPQGDTNPVLFTQVPTRLPTYTPAPVIAVPTYTNSDLVVTGFPMAWVILGLFTLGIIGIVMAVIRWNAK